MSGFPDTFDDDSTIPRLDNNLSELGVDAINSLRMAIFNIQQTLGLVPQGSVDSVVERLNVSLNADGTIKASALASIGLVTLPITNNQVATNAGIAEQKLSLDYSTSSLHSLISSNASLLQALQNFASTLSSNFLTHINGGAVLADNTLARHVASHIDLNDVPSDSRDALFVWSGLKDKNGTLRTAKNVGAALDQINTDLITHENAIADAHNASAVNIDTTSFLEVPPSTNTVQKLADYIDKFEFSTLAEHRATQHANAIPKIARGQSTTLSDGYKQNVVPPTNAIAYLVHSPNTSPVDDLSIGDDLIRFVPSNSGFVFDSQFSQVKVGDFIKINYGSGFEASFPITGIRYVPGAEWIVRINGVNLSDGYVSARIDKPLFDLDTAGVLAVASANATPTGTFANTFTGLTIGHPRGAMALGLNFDPGQIDSNHYKLWLQLYPTGNPVDRVISLPAIDVSGNTGATPGKYTLDSVVQTANNAFRSIGYNYRFLAFAHNGDFGIMLADAINNASFSIISGSNSSGTLAAGTFTKNIIGDATDQFDALGFGHNHADIAGPAYISSFGNATSAQLPTKIISPLKHRYYIVNGQRKDDFAKTWNANVDGYWDGYISDRNPVGVLTIETTYTIPLDLRAAGLTPGKTIVIQPTISFSSPSYFDVDYGRFIIKAVNFSSCCPGDPFTTKITVINGLHASGNGFGFSSAPNLPVRIYFSQDSLNFDKDNIIDSSPSVTNYHRLHEIFIDDKGKTWNKPRARMPAQSESSHGLRTDIWHIEDVSPKLRGYKDNPTTFNKYVRLYILDYDSSTGEFDGYIGKRVAANNSILSVGPIVHGRKNIPVKFYDETNIDFIELRFAEDSTSSPGISVLTDTTPRFVDIELFDSLRVHDEFLLLATCEVNWHPLTGQDMIERVINRREFGSVDEQDFTDSAIEFISAGDRYLHENGIIRGFDFDSINTSDNRQVYFKGGLALVDGKILAVNNSSVTIPQIYETGTSPPTTVNWAVCINKFGKLEPIVLTATKQQFFATDGTTTFYVPSVTFAELVEARKDLTPISVVTAHIASFTLSNNDVFDVRRFLGYIQNSFTPVGFVGSFHSFSAVKAWVNNYRSSDTLKIKVRGEFLITSSLDFTGFNYSVSFEGDGTVFNITSSKGLLIDNNISFKEILFNYNPTGITYTTNDKINSANGCIYGSVGSMNNIRIDNCVFNSTLTTQRPPFISFELNNEYTLYDLKITNCKFNDALSTTASHQAAISILSLNDSISSNPVIVKDVDIINNICNCDQGIYLTVNSDSSDQIVAPGILPLNVKINENSCGTVGIITSAKTTSSLLFTNSNRTYGISVKDNNCHIIGNIVNYISSSSNPGTFIFNDLSKYLAKPGELLIEGNKLNWSTIFVGDYSTGSNFNSTKIINNDFRAFDLTFLNLFAVSTLTTSAALTLTQTSSFDQGTVLIQGNSFDVGVYNGTTAYHYNYAITGFASFIISNNIFRGMTTAHIFSFSIGGNQNINVSNNQFYRLAASITNYITLGSGAHGFIVDNFFDSTTIDGASTDLILKPSTVIAERNKNQTESAKIYNFSGVYSTALLSSTFPILLGSANSHLFPFIGTTVSDYLGLRYDNSGVEAPFYWKASLFDILPKNVTVLTISTIALSDTLLTDGYGVFTLAAKASAAQVGTPATIDFTGSYTPNNPLTVTVTGINTVNSVSNALSIELSTPKVKVTASGSTTITFQYFTVTYRW